MTMLAISKNKISFIPFTILILGIIVRLLYVNYFGSEINNNYYVHDASSHIQYVQFVAQHLSLPKVNKGLEYPQQPLYYIVMGICYRLLSIFLSSSDVILIILIWFSSLFSIGALFFTYLLAKKITASIWVQSFIIGLFAFTPSLVYQSGMINNDSLLAFFAAGAFLFLLKFTKDEKIKDIILAITFATLAAYTKITGGIILIIILFTLLYKNHHKITRKSAIILTSAVVLIGILIISTTLWRAYLPSAGKFHLVESYAYSGQIINPTHLSYFLNFDLPKLLKEGQSFVWNGDSTVKTFPTFLYGSFLFGEYSYSKITNTYPFIKILMQLIILTGLLFPIGFIANLFYIKKWSIIDYATMIGFIINLALIILFLRQYPSVCNSDFRYFASLFLPIIMFSAAGLYRSNELIKIKSVLPILSFVLISSELFWITERIIIKIFTNI